MIGGTAGSAPGPLHVHRLDGSCALPAAEIGGKAWSINAMRRGGLPVPPAIVVDIAACNSHRRRGEIESFIWTDVLDGLRGIEAATGRRLGDGIRPLLLSVRSGAARSMPGMMDTILNLGMNDAVERALAAEIDPAFAADTRSRFVTQFRAVTGLDQVPDDPLLQLRAAIEAVFGSWNAERAKAYRAHHGISEQGGTAATIQAMVFGNLDRRSGTGVLFTRNPLTGAAAPYGEWLGMAQGEDVVSGRHTPEPLEALARDMPDIYEALLSAAGDLERQARDVQDIEFTVQAGVLWLLQTRMAKRSARAAVRWAVALCRDGVITQGEAVLRVSIEQVEALGRPTIDPAALAAAELLASGEPAAPGVALGRAVDDVDQAIDLGDIEDIILVRPTTAPEDIHGMIAARGIVTASGGATSHAAVVSRELGRPCIVGCGTEALSRLAGLDVTIDGDSGRIYRGRLAIEAPSLDRDPDLRLLAEWAASVPDGSRLVAALTASGVQRSSI